MLLNLHKKTWMDGLTLAEYSEHSRLNENIVSEMLELAKNYNKVKMHIIIYLIMYKYNLYLCIANFLNTFFFFIITTIIFYRLWKTKKK